MSEELKPCPCCKCCDPIHDLTMPTSVSDGIEYVVCQICGLRVDADSWNLIPRIPQGFALVSVEVINEVTDVLTGDSGPIAREQCADMLQDIMINAPKKPIKWHN